MINPEPGGYVAPYTRWIAAPAESAYLEAVLKTVQRSLSGDWVFPSVGEWGHCFRSLEDALPFAAMMEASQRYLWWVCGDIAEALLNKFGRTAGVKASLGAVFGCKARTIEYRTKAATIFTPERRHPDVPTELYREALMWDDPMAVLEAALDKGRNTNDLRLERMGSLGYTCGPPIWSMQEAHMTCTEKGGRTEYTIRIVEDGGARFARREFPVVVTVAPLVTKSETPLLEG